MSDLEDKWQKHNIKYLVFLYSKLDFASFVSDLLWLWFPGRNIKAGVAVEMVVLVLEKLVELGESENEYSTGFVPAARTALSSGEKKL